ncbi:hypothetical protein [Tabrizicola sp.]|uniref:hypothetical protein n=1 Tax=Tabrizicola sp. TaxID=2005166 RepID=UPI002FDF0428
MKEFLSNWNQWITDHQALVVAVGLPLLTALASAIVAFLTSKASLKSQNRDRAFQREAKIFDYEMSKIAQLRTAAQRYETTEFLLGFDLNSGRLGQEVKTIPRDRANKMIDDLVALMIEISLLVDPADSEAGVLDAALRIQVRDFSDECNADSGEKSKRFFPVCKRIIDRMEAKAKARLAT